MSRESIERRLKAAACTIAKINIESPVGLALSGLLAAMEELNESPKVPQEAVATVIAAELYAKFVDKMWRNNLALPLPNDGGPKTQLTTEQADLVACALGIAGEAGEVVDEIKKMTIGFKVTSIATVIEELGDLEFYLQKLRTLVKISREEILEDNRNKLTKRFPERLK